MAAHDDGRAAAEPLTGPNVHGAASPNVDDLPGTGALAPGGTIGFVRLEGQPGVELMDVRHVSRKWAYFHETYTFCVASWVDRGDDVPWKYRRRTHLMNVDRVQLMEPGEFHSNLTVAPPADFRVLMLAPALVERVARSLGWESTSPLHLRTGQLGDGPVRRVLQRLTSIIVEGGDPRRVETGIRALLRTLSEHHCLETPIPNKPPRVSLAAALRAREIIHDRWNEHITIDELTDEVNVPLSTLERTFTKAFGAAPRHYQNHVRLTRGRQLLLNTRDSIASVARLCGFQDPKYFARLFRREFARSPQGYRAGCPR